MFAILCLLMHKKAFSPLAFKNTETNSCLVAFPLHNFYTVSNDALLLHIGKMWCTALCVRFKYYFAWQVAEGSAILSGFGYDSKTSGWNNVANMDIVSFEGAQSIRNASRSWNQQTQSWLERYVYTRSGNSLALTYFVSALWHGFYPGYYFFFMSCT